MKIDIDLGPRDAFIVFRESGSNEVHIPGGEYGNDRSSGASKVAMVMALFSDPDLQKQALEVWSAMDPDLKVH